MTALVEAAVPALWDVLDPSRVIATQVARDYDARPGYFARAAYGTLRRSDAGEDLSPVEFVGTVASGRRVWALRTVWGSRPGGERVAVAILAPSSLEES